MTWNTDVGLDWGDGEDPAHFAAINYHMVQALREDLSGKSFDHAVEIGCGYGRVTPWLLEFAEEVTGVEPNLDVLSLVERYYPEVDTVAWTAQDLPLHDDGVNLVFTRSVLQHVPDEDVRDIATEIERVADSDCVFIVW